MKQNFTANLSSQRVGGTVPKLGPYSTPFCHAIEAWFWASGAIASRRDGCRSGSGSGVVRPCEPDDVMTCLDQLYQKQRITLAHARVLVKWGERRVAPCAREPAEANDARLWGEALLRLEWVMRAKGILA